MTPIPVCIALFTRGEVLNLYVCVVLYKDCNRHTLMCEWACSILLFPHRVGGGGFTVPGNLAISVSELMFAVDCACARSNADCGMKQHSSITQEHLLNCIMSTVSNSL